LQAAFTDILHQPGQMQRLLAALSSQPTYALPDPSAPVIEPKATSSQLTSYDPPYDFYREFSGEPASAFNPVPLLTSLNQPETDDTGRSEAVAEDASRIQKTYQDADEIHKDVNALQSSITSLIESLGIDTSVMSANQVPNGVPDPPPASTPIPTSASLSSGMDESNTDTSNLDFDFHAFLNEFSGNGDEDNYIDHVDSTAFLDEVPSPSDGASPVTNLRHDSPIFSAKTSPPRKRKSDIAELDQQHTKNSNPSGTKSKRKR